MAEQPTLPNDSARLTDAPRRTRDHRRPRSGWLHPGSIAAIAFAVVLVLASAVDALASAGRIHPGTRVEGVKVGGLKPAAASAKLKRELPLKTAEPVTVVHAEKSWPVAPGDIGLTFDYDALADNAMGVGREHSALAAAGSRITAWFGGRDLDAMPAANPEMLDATLNRIAEGTDIAPIDATVDIKGTTPEVVPGKKGVGLVRDKATKALLRGFLSASRRVEAPVGPVDVKVNDAAAEVARKQVVTMLSAPVRVTFESKHWEFAPADIAEWISFRAVEASAGGTALEPFVSAVEASKTIAPKLGGGIGRPARDAAFKTRSGSVIIVPSQEGVGPDIDALADDMTTTLLQSQIDRAVVLRTRTTQPKLTTEQAKSYGINERISTFTTTYESSNRPRVNNIHLLGDALDGKLVAPGATFSFNGAVGERTAAKGYKEANAIVNGKLVPQLGGGICQVGTTLFNAVFESGLPVVQRSNHSFYISHYPKGRDATVSWGGPDLKFKNDTENWVLVSVSYSSSSITISLYGTDPGYTVTSQTGAWTNERAFPVEEVKDATLPQGVKVIEDGGVTGRKIVVTRTVKKGGVVVRTDSFVSNYKPKTQVVRVGTKPKGSKATTGTAN